MIDKKISPQEHKFVLAYLETGKAGLSAKLAGYSEKSCDSQANRLLKREKIQKQIEIQTKHMSDMAGWNKSRVISELENLYPNALEDKSYTASKAILTLLGRELGLFKEHKEVKHAHSFEEHLTSAKLISKDKPAITMN